MVGSALRTTITIQTITSDSNGLEAGEVKIPVAKGEMHWKQQNSGGGFWVYTGRFVTKDSIEGTAVLRDWPQLPAGQKPPAGTFALARRAPGA